MIVNYSAGGPTDIEARIVRGQILAGDPRIDGRDTRTVRPLNIEVGGGLRDEASIKQLLDIGVSRVIIGTKAVSDFEWFSDMAHKFAGRLVLGDPRSGGEGQGKKTRGGRRQGDPLARQLAAQSRQLDFHSPRHARRVCIDDGHAAEDAGMRRHHVEHRDVDHPPLPGRDA